jgi:polyisoprenoid-binding protein YceI
MFTQITARILLVTLTGVLLTRYESAQATEYAIDSARTVVWFEMHGFGSRQQGKFDEIAGTVMFDPAANGGRVDIVIDARSLEANSEVVEKMARGPAMLNVGVHQQIAYSAERVRFVGGEPALIEGELTMLGVTRIVPLAVTQYDCTSDGTSGGQRCSLMATATFKRSEFGMTRYRALASDDVKLAIEAEGVQLTR